jgi:chromate transporter
MIAIFLTPDLIENQPVVAAIFRGIRPAVVALIIAPVITTARSAGINWRTVWIPAAVALLIWSKLPWVSNPILFIALGALGGWTWLRRSERKAAAERLNSERVKGGNIQSEIQSGRKEENR